MKVRLSLRAPKTNPRIVYDWKTFAADSEMQEKYTVEVRNRFQILEDEEDPSSRYQRFIEANMEATRTCVPRRKRVKASSSSKHPDIVQAREKMEEASRKLEETGSDENREQLKEAKELLFNTYDRLKEEKAIEACDRIQAAHGDGRYSEAWKVVNEMTERKKAKEGQVAGASPEERVATWFTHFKNLLGTVPSEENSEGDISPVYSNLDINDGPFTREEYAKVKSSLKSGKSAGPDNIPPEVYKSCELDDIILSICNLALMKNEKPVQWSLSNIIPVPKSGNLSCTDNYRGISLTCIITKLYNRMILNRIRSAIDPKLRYNQNGFRPKRTTVAQILALRRIIEEVKRNNLTAVLTFIDFKKAFDSINRSKMMKILKAYGVPPNLLRAIKEIYTNTRAKVITPDGETEEFDIFAGVLQGDTLAPFLFIIVLDYAMRQATGGMETNLGFTITPKRSRRTPAVTLTDLDFADDICLLCNQIHQAQELLSRVETECGKVGLGLNAKKTEVMTYNISGHEPLKTNAGNTLKEVDDFKYLGSWMDSTDADILRRKALAWRALNNMTKIWKSHMSRQVKLSLFLATVESILLYGCETWTMTKALEKSLDGCYTRMLSAVLNISWRQHMSNDELYGELPRASNKIAARRMELAGHCYRHPELATSRLILWEPGHGHRQRGRQRMTYVDVMRRDANAETSSELASCMKNREDWKIRARARLRPP
jgi:hypothetical protein